MDSLPPGWVEISPLDVATIIRGVSYAKGEARLERSPGYVSLLRANNISDGQIVFEDLQHVPNSRVSEEQMLRVNDLVLAMSSGSKAVVGKAAVIRNPWHGTFGAFCGVLRPNSAIDGRFFSLFFQTKAYRNAISQASAGTNINNLKREHFERLPFPLPPLAEQRRIVAKVEAVLARVNAARQRLAKAPALLKRFRQSVLAAACSGRLTADWRGDGVDDTPDGWKASTHGETYKLERGRFLARPRNDPQFFGGSHPFIQIGCLPPNGGLITKCEQTLNEKGLEVSRKFPKGTVLIAIVGATIGNTGILSFDSCCPDSLVAVKAGTEI